jgi:hypothetical protein
MLFLAWSYPVGGMVGSAVAAIEFAGIAKSTARVKKAGTIFLPISFIKGFSLIFYFPFLLYRRVSQTGYTAA